VNGLKKHFAKVNYILYRRRLDRDRSLLSSRLLSSFLSRTWRFLSRLRDRLRDRAFDLALGDRDFALGDRDRAFGDRDRAFGDLDRAFGVRDRAFGDRLRRLPERSRCALFLSFSLGALTRGLP